MLRPRRTRTLYRLPLGPAAPAAAREIAARELADLQVGDEALADTKLLLAELVTERLEQGQPDRRLIVEIIHARQHRWCVVDHREPSLPTGLRCQALNAFASAWGVSRTRGLTHTWFELPLVERAAGGSPA